MRANSKLANFAISLPSVKLIVYSIRINPFLDRLQATAGNGGFQHKKPYQG